MMFAETATFEEHATNTTDRVQAVSRRQAIAGLMGAALVSAVARPTSAKGETRESLRLVDVHHHLTPPEQIARLGPQGVAIFDVLKNWSVQKSLDAMDHAGIHAALLSITSPGLWFNDGRASTLARACNEYSASLVHDHQGRFGFFAALPFHDTTAALEEAAYALDTLGASGVHLFTSYPGRYLGDPSFTPLFEELNRRKAIVFVHPSSNSCCTNLVPGVPENVIEFGTETTRTIASLLFSGTAARVPAVKFIFSHAGGTMPSVIERFEFLARTKPGVSVESVRATLARFYYDTAQAANRTNLTALKTIAPPSQLLFGSDYPFRDIREQVEALKQSGLPPMEADQILARNFARL